MQFIHRKVLTTAFVAFLTLLGCSSDPDAVVYAQRPLAVGAADAILKVPFRNGFDGSWPGLLDSAGLSTGFPFVLPTSAGAGHLPEHLSLDTAAGVLAITTTAGIAAGVLDTQDNALGARIGLPSGIFRVAVTLLSPPPGSGAYEQAGIWFGVDQKNMAKLVLMSAPDALVIQASLEAGDLQRPPLYLTVPSAPERVRLSLEIDPLRRELRAYATLGTGAERLVGTLPDVPASWLGVDFAASATLEGTPPGAGIFATHRRRASALGPLTYRFDDFTVDRRLALPGESDIVGSGWAVVPAFPRVTFNNPTGLVEAPTTGHLFISEREGRVFAIPRVASAADKRLVLDLSTVTQGHQDLGLLGLAFHPEFGDRASPNGRYMYVHYARNEAPVPPPVALNVATESRLSRFSVDLDTLVADPSSELVLIAQQDEHVWHQGGAMFFHPADGFLYLTVGDEGGSLCALDNCQRIDRDLFGGVLRLDVDMRGGDVSHPIPLQPETGATANYFIPNDNPFVGRGGLEEFYAIGLRSPHRMTYDAVDDITWIGDVGQNHREELDVLSAAANYQWEYREGFETRLQMSEPPLGTWTDPVIELPRSESNAVIGGVVYRGSEFPELAGKYIFGDHVYGTIWALSYAYDGVTARPLERQTLLTNLLGRSGTITSFGVDADDHLYVLTMGDRSQILRLSHSVPPDAIPPLLSRVGAFDDVAALLPSADLVPYEVQSPLWSDGAVKRRWMLAPPGGEVHFARDGAWTFPEGTVFIKHFEMALDEAHPAEKRRLETRLLVAARDGYYGISYKWNPEGTDAAPVFESETEELDVLQADGSVRHQQYFYPGPNDCMVCHNADAGYVLGVRTAQLNGTVDDDLGVERPQLLEWSERGLLDADLDAATLATLPSLANLGDESRSVEDRVRSYWDSNCSMCHGVIPTIRATWDARYQTPLANQGVVYGTLAGEAELPDGSFVVAPGDPQHSALWLRDGSDDPTLRMPPLGRQRVDAEYLALLQRWITSLPPR